MAKGRMINNRITSDKRIHEMSDDTSRLAFTWLITFADCEGRTYGDPAIVRSVLFPRRSDVSIEQMETYITEWAELGLILWYEAEGDLWITFNSFNKNQANLRKDREPASAIPQFLPDNCRILAGYLPDECPVKLTEVKRTEQNMEGEGENPPNVFRSYEQEIGVLTPMTAEKLKDLQQTHPAVWIVAAIRIASTNGKRSLAYCEAILRRWAVEGYGSELRSGNHKDKKNEPAGFQGLREWLISKGEFKEEPNNG